MTTIEVAKIIGVGKGAVRSLCDRGKFGPFRTYGNERRISASGVAAYLREVAPDIFFDREDDSPHAVAVCQRCPVRSECLKYALDRNIADGIWGGKTPTERRQLLPDPNPALPRANGPRPKLDDQAVEKLYRRYLRLKDANTTGHGQIRALAIEFDISDRALFRYISRAAATHATRTA
ncbi:WhiB family transcriptional regulator [Nocardia vinacea]|uniref:WhiB family transcriptional regulator n=1 Tax=Nocardia vinacea TaxID=96468 RepID=UPI0033F7DE2B